MSTDLFDRQKDAVGQGERTILVHIELTSGSHSNGSVDEFQQLAESSGLNIVETLTIKSSCTKAQFFIGTGKSIKTILSQGKDNTVHELWEKIKYIKTIIFPHIMLTLTLVGGLYIFYFGYIKSNIMNESTPYSWIQAPLFFIALIHHMWSLKIKNDAFREQIAIISELEPDPKEI